MSKGYKRDSKKPRVSQFSRYTFTLLLKVLLNSPKLRLPKDFSGELVASCTSSKPDEKRKLIAVAKMFIAKERYILKQPSFMNLKTSKY